MGPDRLYSVKPMIQCLLLLFSMMIAAAQSPITGEAAVNLPHAASFLVSPDGRNLSVASPEVDWTTGIRKNQWKDLQGKFSFDPATASNVVWTADGRGVAFFRTDKGKTFLYATSSVTGAIEPVCELYTPNAYLAAAGNRISWSRDGEQIAFVGTLEPQPAVQDPLVIDRIQYKTRTEFSDNRRSRIFVVDAKQESKAKALTSDSRDAHSVAWGVGPEVIYLANPGEDGDANLNYDIYAVNVNSGAVRTVVNSQGVEMEPQVSPDGKWIAYRATTRAITTIDSVAEDAHVWVVPYAGGTPREVNRALDRRCAQLRWMPDSKTVVYLATDRGSVVPYRSNIDSLETTPLHQGRGTAAGLQLTSSGDVYFTFSEPTKPADLFRIASAGVTTKLTEYGAEAAKQWKLVEPETFRFRSFDQTEVESFLYLPIKTSGKLPLILNIHGGPHSMHGYGFNGSLQYYVSRGYAVLAVNPRGSSGYGQKFADGCINDWGRGDYRDLMLAVDAALRRYPQLDANRMGVMGASYGGYMTNWVITQTDRFRAAVPVASLSNLISFYATSLYQDLIHAEFNGFPWAGGNFKVLWELSPLAHIKNVKTPTLLIHGENDNDVHITQSEEMFTALRHRGVPATFVRYAREGHSFREPKHQLDMLKRVSEWMDEYLKSTQ